MMKNLSILLAATLFLPQITALAQPKPPRLIGSATSSGDVFLAGGYSKEKGWFFDQTARALVKPGTKWRLARLDGSALSLTTGKVTEGEGVGGFVALSTRANAAPSDISDAATQEMLALSNVPNAQPRRARVQGLKAPIYASEAKKLLSRAGLKVKIANLTQLVRVDLNGDGREEALFCARSRADFGKTPETRVGDYNLVALRCLVNGKVKTLPLMVETNKKASAFGAPNRSEIMACADIDGDGKMEIVVSTGYYEGWGMEIWTFDGKSVKRVLSAGWGA